MEKVSFGPIWNDIQKVRDTKSLDEAIQLANQYLMSDPTNEEALLQLVDIYYVKGELEKAEKPVNFLLQANNPSIDKTMLYYIKAVISVDKTLWDDARKYIRLALKDNPKNPEFLRIYGLSEFWSGNKSKWFEILKQSLENGSLDAEILLDLVSMAMKMQDFDSAMEYVNVYFKYRAKLKFFSNPSNYYDGRMKTYKDFLIEKNNKDGN